MVNLRVVLLTLLARVLRLVSMAICLIAVAWFLTFAVNQTSSASNHQTTEINAVPGSAALSTSTSETKNESAPRKALDEVFSKLSSPFSGLTSGSGVWTIHLVDTLLVLIVYGFGLAFVARLLRLGL
jgi:TRAP-type C4-dicarboxylate transport system permease small subunit